MRLLRTNSKQLELCELLDTEACDNGYAILSHVWNISGEITLDDVNSQEGLEAKSGFAKVTTFCSLAKAMQLGYAWTDTCCINKHNFTELSEALNSMYRWYTLARICIVYLEDIGPGVRMSQSRWFKRGWTLQELIAPKRIYFYDRHWTFLGDKRQYLDLLSHATGIPKAVLDHRRLPQSCSIAQRMSWAAGRETTRIEDRAYSLLGLFDISLPMLYGQQERAFIHLQEKIIRTSNDQTIFAWTKDPRAIMKYSGLFALSPDAFEDCQRLVAIPNTRQFSMTQNGLSITLPLHPHSVGKHLAELDVTDTASRDRYGILVARLPTDGQYARVRTRDGLSLLSVPKSTGREPKPHERQTTSCTSIS